jgi:hypothetical protein
LAIQAFVLLLACCEGHLVLFIESVTLLQDEFWPITRFAPSLENQLIVNGTVRNKYDEGDHFLG